MIQKLAKMVAIVALAVTPLIGSGAAYAHDISSNSARLYNAEWHGGGWHGGNGWHGGGWYGGNGWHGGGWHGGFYPYYHGGYYPGYYGHGPCYLTVYGTIYCY
jgi:hypothetical protein